jgi:hypothetical protein
MAEATAVDIERANYDRRDATDHGVPAILRGTPDGGYQGRSTLVRVTEPGAYYLHLVQAGDGRVWAAFTRGFHTPDDIIEEVDHG